MVTIRKSHGWLFSGAKEKWCLRNQVFGSRAQMKGDEETWKKTEK